MLSERLHCILLSRDSIRKAFAQEPESVCLSLLFALTAANQCSHTHAASAKSLASRYFRSAPFSPGNHLRTTLRPSTDLPKLSLPLDKAPHSHYLLTIKQIRSYFQFLPYFKVLTPVAGGCCMIFQRKRIRQCSFSFEALGRCLHLAISRRDKITVNKIKKKLGKL